MLSSQVLIFAKISQNSGINENIVQINIVIYHFLILNNSIMNLINKKWGKEDGKIS